MNKNRKIETKVTIPASSANHQNENQKEVNKMKNALIFFILMGILLIGCSAPIKIAKYPGKDITYVSKEQCEDEYEKVRVLGEFPPADKYVEIGFMVVSQESSWEMFETSGEKQIQAARIQACEWGADAIVIVGYESEKGTSFDFWSGSQYHDEKSTRISAIKLIEPEE